MALCLKETADSDLDIVLAVNRQAFGRDDEANLVANLLHDPTAKPLLSLLAFQDEEVVGHILFTKVDLEGKSDCLASILCPMAVIPKFQKQGIGGRLICGGLEILTKRGVSLVFVLGHPSYYPRYGFEPAGQYGFEATYPIEEKNAGAWMVRALQPHLIGKYQGRIICADTLNKPQYWQE